MKTLIALIAVTPLIVAAALILRCFKGAAEQTSDEIARIENR